jgi:alkanesulfonate monooxygenase SsuD/methylene tetrahydromethanopterin reductase-like flavin-dependent oxidoreductase (luciferase family)
VRRPGVVLSLPTVGDTVAASRLAEAAGLESVWATEFTDRSATVAMAAMAGETETITIGSAIAYAFGRTPLVLAAEARDLDAVSDGRLILGTGTKRMQRDWHGLDPERREGLFERTLLWPPAFLDSRVRRT